jgi:hypothetical protein
MDRLAGFPVLETFAEVAQPAAFAPLTDGWLVGLTDVTRSTEAVAAGGYKAVNIAGAAAISAVMNALGTRQLPFSFMGDGCAFAVPRDDEAKVREALARTVTWVRDDLALLLRASLVPVEELRAEGTDVRVALFRPSPHVSYAMFDGGGLALAEKGMKTGRWQVEAAPPGERPDLTGLSCRWLPLKARRGAIVSVIVLPGSCGDAAFREAVRGLVALLGEDRWHPVPEAGPRIAPFTPGMRLEALASRGERPLWRRMIGVAAHHLMGWGFFMSGLRAGKFDPVVYRAMTSANADPRKFGDGLLLTLDCDAGLERDVARFLAASAAEGAVRYGLHRQSAALMTCVVPSYEDHGHFHFIDGAEGGYTAAAEALRASKPTPDR